MKEQVANRSTAVRMLLPPPINGSISFHRRLRAGFWLGSVAALVGGCAQLPNRPYATATEQQAAMAAGTVTSRALVAASLHRIEQIDHAGPTLNSVIAVNPAAVADAEARDRERREGRVRGPLHGVTVILKDNVEADGALPTTAGSLALRENVTHRDAPIVARIREAGAVILGKANLSEWANFRSSRSISGWSAVGGMTRNPYALDRSPCGSSSGTAVAVSAGLATVGIGTETDGSIICPASTNGVVGFKPTLGLVSRSRIVPISPEQDTAGPIARSVADAAALLTVIAGSDPKDAATRDADIHRFDYVTALDARALSGARVGVMRGLTAGSPASDAVFEQALAALRAAGATLVEVQGLDDAQKAKLSEAEGEALRAEFRAAIDAYLATTPPQVTARTLDDLIEFNSRSPEETALFGQETFEKSAKTPNLEDATYRKNRETAQRLAGPEGLDRILREANVEALVAPTSSPATVVDPVNGTRFLGSPSSMPAVAGYPHLTVPMGNVLGLPVGLSFIGPKWSDGRMLALGYAFEQATQARVEPEFLPTLNSRPEIAEPYERK